MINEALDKAGLDTVDKGKITLDLASADTLGSFLSKMKDNKRISEENKSKIVIALAEKWKSDPSSIEKLDKSLKADSGLVSKLEAATIANPNAVIEKTIKGFNGSNLAAVIPAASPAVQKSQPAAQNKMPEKAAEPKVVVETTHKAAAHAHVAKPHKDKDTVAVSVAKEHEKPVDSGAISSQDRELFKNAFESLADEKDDAKVSKAVGGNLVSSVVDSLADDAVSKYGVDESTAAGFKQKVNDPKHPELKEAITRNLKNNPEFVRELAKASKDKTELSGAAKDMARSTMTEFMEQPDKLANDAYVKSLTSKMKTASSFSGFGQAFSDLFGPEFGKQMQAFFSQISGAFSGLGDKAKVWFGGFQGKSVLSMSTSGNSMFPTVMINMKNFNDNMTKAQIFSRYDAGRDMTTLPIKGTGGSLTHTVEVKDAQGNITSKEVINTVSIQDSKGKKHEVVPSVGQIMALKQADGTYDVAMVTNMDPKTGRGTDMKSINMTEKDFMAYKTDVENRSGRKYPVNEEPSVTVAQQQASVMKVDVKNGRVNEDGVQTWGLDDPNAPRGKSLRWEDVSSNDPERAMKINL